MKTRVTDYWIEKGMFDQREKFIKVLYASNKTRVFNYSQDKMKELEKRKGEYLSWKN